MEQIKLKQLKELARDESLSEGLRAAAQKQLRDLGELPPTVEQQQPETELEPATPEPSADFVFYRLGHAWKKLADPKPPFEKWCVSAAVKEMIRVHDACIDDSVAHWRQRAADDPSGSAALISLIENHERSSLWRRLTLSDGTTPYTWLTENDLKLRTKDYSTFVQSLGSSPLEKE